ncbi:MAG: DUF799 family lipoprotein [Parabacteroides sp.]|nr:DUF799 family lipoprotein [Parabacteroides sp.]
MKNLLLIGLICVWFTSCSTSSLMTRGSNYPNMYTENPVTLLVMPPINKTTHVEAKEYFYTSLAQPLCDKGYYVISPFLAMEMFKGESAYDSEQFINGSLDPFRNVFGADAVLFTTINSWSKSALGGSITVNIEYELKSTRTRETLFKRAGQLTVDTSVSDSNILLSLVSSAINTALTDKIVAARRCNNYVLQDLPVGKYSSLNGQDKDVDAGNVNFTATVKE